MVADPGSVPGAAHMAAIRPDLQAAGDGDRCVVGHRSLLSMSWPLEAHGTELTGLLRQGPTRDPTRRLACIHAGVRPPGMAAPGRPADPVRGRRRLAVPAAGGHRTCRSERRLAGNWPTSAPHSGARTSGRPDLHRQDTGIGRFPSDSLAINAAWLSLIAAALLSRLRLPTVDGPAHPQRGENPPLPDPADVTDPGSLAIGRCHRDRLSPYQRPTARLLTSAGPSLRSRKENPGALEP